MRNVAFLLALMGLAACGRWSDNYQPQLAAQPEDAAQYEVDRKTCIEFTNSEAERLTNESIWRPTTKQSISTHIPILGLVLAATEQDSPDHVDNTHKGIANRCMAQKGYDVILK